MKNYTVDMTAKQLTMLDARFYYEDEVFCPSVTTILSAYPKDESFYRWLKENGQDADNIRDDAGRRGSVVHNLTERYDRGEEVSLLTLDGDIKFRMAEWSMFERYVDFCSRFNPKYDIVERTFVSPKLGFAGTIDRYGLVNEKNMLIDIKTSNHMHDVYWLQLSAYRELMRDHTDYDLEGGAAILHLNAKTRTNGSKGAIQGPGWQLITRTKEELDNDYKLFLITKELWEAQNKDFKPRKSTYNLSYKKEA